MFNFSVFLGYLKVDTIKYSNLFFWFIPAKGTEILYEDNAIHQNDDNTPLLLWLNGGPGATSMYGLFHENGPFFINDDGKTLRGKKQYLNKLIAVLL